MSPESILLSAASAAPSAPQPARSSPVAASHAAADSSLTNTGQPQATPSAAPAGQSGHRGSEPAPARPATGHPGGRKDSADRQPDGGHKTDAGHKTDSAHKHDAGHKHDTGHKHAASKTDRAKGHSAQPATRPARSDGSFSQALAQSLATAGRSGGASSDTARGHGPQAGKPATHAPSKEGKSDPVVSTLALVSQALPAAPPPAATAGAGTDKGRRTVVSASLLGNPKGAGHDAKALLAHAAAQDLKTLGPAEGSTAAAPNTAPVNAAAVLTSTQASAAAGAAAPTHAAAPAHTAANPAAALSAPVGTTAWTDQLGTQLTWMTHQGIGSASLQLSPEHLGPLQVSISVHHGQASVWFGAAHPETRQALEQAMPQLRQMFSGQGLTLTDSGVSRDSPRGQAPRKESVGQVGAIAEEPGVGTSGSLAAHLGLVDAYA